MKIGNLNDNGDDDDDDDLQGALLCQLVNPSKDEGELCYSLHRTFSLLPRQTDKYISILVYLLGQ